MNAQQMLMMLPGIQPDELMLIQNLTSDMNETQQQQFFTFYTGKRKEEQVFLFMTIFGFFGVAGIQRFVIGETVMGILFFFTVGFCGIGTIIDLVNIKNITSQFNQKQAIEAAGMVKMMNG